jgi:hypothetical protein
LKISEMVEKLGLENMTPEVQEEGAAEITGGHAADLLSDVLANAPHGGVLVTIQCHLNVIAVALHAELAAVIFAAGRRPDEAVKKKAVEEGIQLYGSKQTTFDIVGQLYALGLRGRRA